MISSRTSTEQQRRYQGMAYRMMTKYIAKSKDEERSLHMKAQKCYLDAFIALPDDEEIGLSECHHQLPLSFPVD
jgi:hypothetical protein